MSQAAQATTNGAHLGRALKEKWVDELKRSLKGTDTVVLTKFDRISAKDVNVLRQKLQGVEASLYMVKNRLCQLVFRDLGWKDLESMLEGTCGISSVRGDAAAVAKLLVDFSKEHEGFVLQGGLLGGEILKTPELVSLAKLPSRDTLLTQVLGGIQAPLTGLVGTLQGVQRTLVGVIHAILKKQE